MLSNSLQPAAAANKNTSSARQISRNYTKSDTTVLPFIKFGPLFAEHEEESVTKAKEEAWQYVVSSCKSREAIVTEIYISSIRKIEKRARASYVPDPILDNLSSKDFRDMMLKDSCLFLQLSFSLLRGDDDNKLDDFPHLRNINLSNKHKWMESMLYVGNQIPLVVLRELLKKRYFRNVVKNGNWKEPSLDLAKKALFRVLLSPVIYSPQWRFPYIGKHAKRMMHWTQQLKESCDILHGIHLLLLGPEIDPEKEEYQDDDDDDVDHDLEEENRASADGKNRGGSSDLDGGGGGGGDGYETKKDQEKEEEDDNNKLKNVIKLKQASVDDKYKAANDTGGGSSSPDGGGGCCGCKAKKDEEKEDENEDDDNKNKKLKNVIKLKQAGIHFGVTKEGIRGIRFKSNLIYPKLYLPQLFVGSHTRLLHERLKQYEQNLDPNLREVTSYLQFMRDLVRTTQDAKILASDGIIKGTRKYTQKLSEILLYLVPDDKIMDDNSILSPVKIEINSFYRPPWVSSYFTIVFLLTLLGMIISIVQTFYAILAYHKPPN